MDALSDVLRVIRLSGGVFLEAEFTAPWCISGKVSPEDCKPFLAVPRHVIAFHFVTTGWMRLRVEGSEAIEARAGECRTSAVDGWQVCGTRTSGAPWLCSTLARVRSGPQSQLHAKWACRDRHSRSASIRWWASHRCSTWRCGACTSLRSGCATGAAPWRRSGSILATNRERPSAVRSSANSGWRPPLGASSLKERRGQWILPIPRQVIV